jgi:formate dehydrogenase subunit gamma
MTTLIAKLRMVGGALLIFTLATFFHPAIAQQATSVNPTAQSVKEDQLLNEFGTIRGRGSIPDTLSLSEPQSG